MIHCSKSLAIPSYPKAAGPLKRTALYDLHIKQGAKMVPYAGWEMPLQYKNGVIHEHTHVRTAAGLFDVAHMLQFTCVRVVFV